MASPVEQSNLTMLDDATLQAAREKAEQRTREDDNPFLVGIHKPMDSELTVTELAVDGVIPQQLDGRYMRIGPNPVIPPNPASYHWFTGDGMVHAIRIKNGKALWYRNRWIRSEKVSETLNEEPVPVPEGRQRGNVNTNVMGHAGRTWALVEAGNLPAELSEECDTLAITDLDGTLNGSFTAHPHLDPDSGELHAICYLGGPEKNIWHKVVSAEGKVVREEPIAVDHGPSIHDCALTANYVIIFDMPVTFSMEAALDGRPFPIAGTPTIAHASACYRVRGKAMMSSGMMLIPVISSTCLTPMKKRMAR